MLMSDQLSMFEPPTLPDTGSVTSSPASAAGPMPSVSPAGPTIDPYGPAPVPVSRSVQRANGAVNQTNVTFGLFGSSLSESVDPRLSLESKSPRRKSLVTKEKDREYQITYRKRNRARDLARHARFRAHRKGVDFDLLRCLPELQARIGAGVCEISGLPFNLDGGRTWDSPSLDRIDPQRGYVYGNVRVVLHALNSAMGDWGEAKMLEIARAILNRRREASNALSERLGLRLQESLGTSGSPEYALTWNRKVTPSGHLYWQLAARARRTSGSGCSGWPTPVGNDDNKSVEAHLAMKARMGGNRTAITSLQVISQLAGWPSPHGKTAFGSPASTAKRGALNPAFSRWLMGYPAAWDDCAATAMPSSRKSRRSS
jgi:hypothetical protein